MKRLSILVSIILGGFIMGSCKNPESIRLSESQIAQIKAEIKQAAIDHINAKDAATALSYYADDVIAVSNDTLFPSFEKLAEDVKAYYDILKEVNLAVWEEMHINVINTDAALVTAKFRYSFTSTNNERTDLQGVWTALYIRRNGSWKIRVRHESFVLLK
ncbi:MAG: YybH family protein [Planctomycetota bacterium]|jgi:ketosteroid isomerase-like protein